MHVELLAITPNAEELIARCARISHRSEDQASPENDRKLIRKLLYLGHESILEHASATFLIEDISRSCMAQLTRHRLASFTVESMRYVDYSSAVFVDPASIVESGDRFRLYTQATALALYTYRKLLELGVPHEDARFVLPIGTSTRLAVTANFREWRHIIRLRTSPAAQWEIRKLSRSILEILVQHAPNVFSDLAEMFDVWKGSRKD